MPSLRDIRRRIRSVKNTAQITKAMEMVAASRMRRAQQRVLASRPYAQTLRELIGELGCSVVAVSDVRGGIHREAGLDVQAVYDHLRETRSVVDAPGCNPFT